MQIIPAQSNQPPVSDQIPDDATLRAIKQLYDGFRDPARFIPEALMVQNRRGQMVPFRLKRKQVEFVERIKTRRALGLPIRIIIPKTRRVGMSAIVAANIFHETAFYEGQSALILAHEKAAARNLFSYYYRFEQNYKPYLGIGLPQVLGRSASQDSGSIRWAGRSQIEIATAKNLDFSRSFDFRFLHLSEYAYYRNIRGLMTALVATVADDPGTMIFKESTAQGYNEFYADCVAAQEGESDYELFFVGCFDDEENWRSLERDHVDPIKFEQTLTDEEWMLQERYSLVLEQLYWRRKKLKDYGGDLKRFDQEFPHSLDVAFQSSGRQRFDPKLFMWMPTETPFERGELRREEINRKESVVFRSHQYGELWIWKRFERQGQYVGGVDVAKGEDINNGVGTADPDWCVAEIGERNLGEQVMELHTRRVPTEFAAYLYDLGRWCYEQTGLWIYWVIEVEFSGGNGLSVITEMIRLGYPVDYIYHAEVLDEATSKRKKQLGFIIRPNNRQLLISNHEGMLISRSLTLHSKKAIGEHKTFVHKSRAGGGVKIEHEDGCHDDLVFGCMYLSWAMARAPVFERKQIGDKLPQFYNQQPMTERELNAHRDRLRRINSTKRSRQS